MPTRRHFLQSTAATITTWLLPHHLFATAPAPRFHFIHTDTFNSWPTPDPVAWSLENQGEPILERAATGLAKLTENDGNRIIRLLVRRCRLNLIELDAPKVVVHHWGQHQADLRPFLQNAGRLACPEIIVELRDRKKETTTTMPGDSFLYGIPLATDFLLDLFMTKFANRFEHDADDWQAAPKTNSGFAWAGVEDGMIPWAALKSAWRHSAPGGCMNCDGETLLVNFGLHQVGMFNRAANFVSVCGKCRRSFVDDSVKDVGEWIVANLDVDVRPDAEMVWGKRLKREAKS